MNVGRDMVRKMGGCGLGVNDIKQVRDGKIEG